MPSSRITTNAEIAGVAYAASRTQSHSSEIYHAPTLAASVAGTLSTRTSDSAGTLTLAAGHGFTAGDVISVYWTGGRRYGVTVGVVAGEAVPISGGAGDNLPAEDSDLVAAAETVLNTDFDGDDVKGLAGKCAEASSISFYSAGDTLSAQVDVIDGAYLWLAGGSEANPLAGVIVDYVRASQAGAAARTLELGIAYDAS